MDSNNLQPDTCCAACDGLERTEVPDGFVIFKAETEKVHYLNPTAAIIFELSDGKTNLTAIAEFMRQAYQLPELPLPEVLSCAQNLIGQGLLLQCRT